MFPILCHIIQAYFFEETQAHGVVSREQILAQDALPKECFVQYYSMLQTIVIIISTATILFLHLFLIIVEWMWFHCGLLLSRARARSQVVMTTALSGKTRTPSVRPRDRSFGKRARGAVAIDRCGLCLVPRLGQIKNLLEAGADSLRCFGQRVGVNNAAVAPQRPYHATTVIVLVPVHRHSATKTGS